MAEKKPIQRTTLTSIQETCPRETCPHNGLTDDSVTEVKTTTTTTEVFSVSGQELLGMLGKTKAEMDTHIIVMEGKKTASNSIQICNFDRDITIKVVSTTQKETERLNEPKEEKI